MPENHSNPKDFDFEEYKTFLNSKIQKISTKNNSIPKEEIIDYCCQFMIPATKFFSNTKSSQVSEKLRTIFGTSLKNKPVSVSINKFLLFEFGFICCNMCNKILHKDNFFKHSGYWNGYKHYCVNCQKENRDLEHNRKYLKNNRAKYSHHLALYRAKKIKATPKWLTSEQLLEIENTYSKCKNKSLKENIEYEVDHIIPLQGKNVSGLHVPWNLQIITQAENRKKGNTFKEEESYAGESLTAKRL